MDPDSAIFFVIDLQDANKKLIFKMFSSYYFLKVHHLSKDKKSKRSQNSRFFLLFLLADRRIRIREAQETCGSVGSGFGYGTLV
jgi:hypothetical protein